LDDLNNLDFSNVGIWPAPVKGAVILVLCILLGIGWFYYDTQDQIVRLDKQEEEEQTLRKDFEAKQAKAANLEAYRKQLEEMKQTFGAMLRQLPNKTEVADLLVDVSQTGLAAGLEFELFDPVGEVPKEFYAELPINLKVNGDYHEFGEFISGLAALPRIVTIHDIKIYPRVVERKTGRSAGSLTLEAVARTYRYLDEETGK
jgi:type IV pilus assembly protein PilO